MPAKFAYERMVRMEPREGYSYSTVYVKQTAEQRKQLTQHVQRAVRELIQVAAANEEWEAWITAPLSGYKTTHNSNRSCLDIINDLYQESIGQRRNGELKDYALAPIDRWNRLFKDTDYEFELTKSVTEQKFTRNFSYA